MDPCFWKTNLPLPKRSSNLYLNFNFNPAVIKDQTFCFKSISGQAKPYPNLDSNPTSDQPSPPINLKSNPITPTLIPTPTSDQPSPPINLKSNPIAPTLIPTQTSVQPIVRVF